MNTKKTKGAISSNGKREIWYGKDLKYYIRRNFPCFLLGDISNQFTDRAIYNVKPGLSQSNNPEFHLVLTIKEMNDLIADESSSSKLMTEYGYPLEEAKSIMKKIKEETLKSWTEEKPSVEEKNLIPIKGGDDYDVWYGKDLIEYLKKIGDDYKEIDNLDPNGIYRMFNDENAEITKVSGSVSAINVFGIDFDFLVKRLIKDLNTSYQLTDNEIKAMVSCVVRAKIAEWGIK